MIGWYVLIGVLSVALLGALYEGVLLADQNRHLRVKLDDALNDREANARGFASSVLLEVAHDLNRDAENQRRRGTEAARVMAEVYQSVADWVEKVRVPEVRRRALQSSGVQR